MAWQKRRKRRNDSMWGLLTGPLKIGYGLTRLVADNVRPAPPKRTHTVQVRYVYRGRGTPLPYPERPQSTPASSTRPPKKRLTKHQRVQQELATWTEEDERLAGIYRQPIYRAPNRRAEQRLILACVRVAGFVALLPLWFVWEGLRFFGRAALWFAQRLLATIDKARKTARVAPQGTPGATEE